MILFRSLVFVACFYLWLALCGIAMLPLLVFPRKAVVWMIRFWALGINLLLRTVCGIRVEVRGREHIPTGAALVASKHQCMFDVFGQFAWLPDACFVTKKELVWAPFIGLYALKARMIMVDRAGQATALRQMVRDAKDRFKANRQLVIFPEGTRTAPGAPPDYKPGVAALYRELEVPVHPVAVNTGVHWPAHGVRRTPGLVVFEYLEPIPPGLKRAEFMRLLQERIETASNRLLGL
jgi:1-acyl-sn-glycerol-3-phosphate acyltransferase